MALTAGNFSLFFHIFELDTRTRLEWDGAEAGSGERSSKQRTQFCQEQVKRQLKSTKVPRHPDLPCPGIRGPAGINIASYKVL